MGELLPALSSVVDSGAVDAGVGRPRDPGIEERALVAALEVYMEVGWSGFTLGKVAKQAHMGKSALYLRWPTKEAMLADAFTASDVFFEYRDYERPDVPFLEYVQMLVEDRLTRYYTPTGLAVIRLILENHTDNEELGTIWRNSVGKSVIHTRNIIRDAMRTGDLRPETQRVQLGDALEGGMAMHVMATPHHLLSVGRKKVRRFANELVAGVMGPWVTEQAVVDRSHVLLPLIAQVKGDDAWEDDAQGDGLQNDARDEGCRNDAQGDGLQNDVQSGNVHRRDSAGGDHACSGGVCDDTLHVVKGKSPALDACPQRRGVCVRVYTTTPKKPPKAPARRLRARTAAPRMPMASLKAAGGMAGNPAKLPKADTDLMVDAEVTDPGEPPRGGAAQRR